MARTKEYRHYCPAARTLEVVGEKWSLLIVRDLLAGPQRFTDLLGMLGGITPKWLTLRLRELETAGIVARDQVAGRREVWYRLTPDGHDLAPVIQALVRWGLDHGRPPEPGDTVHPRRAALSTALVLNRRGIHPPHPATWVLRFAPDQAYALFFDGTQWAEQVEVMAVDMPADVMIETPVLGWVAFLRAAPGEWGQRLSDMRLSGTPAHVAACRAAFAGEAS